MDMQDEWDEVESGGSSLDEREERSRCLGEDVFDCASSS